MNKYGSPLPDDDSSMFEWGNAENVAGGGTKKALVDIMGNVTGTEFTYIKNMKIYRYQRFQIRMEGLGKYKQHH